MFLKYLFGIILLTSTIATAAQWQQQVNYSIDVKLDDKNHALDGTSLIEYVNNSPDTLSFFWVHLWMNAFKNDKTAFSEQQLENGDTKFYFSSDAQKGYVNRLKFQSEQTTLAIEDHPQHIDIVKVILDKPLLPATTKKITVSFHVQLPQNFDRGGHYNQSYQITQWYPKVAMYDNTGWHEMPYLAQGEFYNNFGNYTVRITVPQNYVVAATGELQNQDEIQWLKERKNFILPKPTTPTKSKSTNKKQGYTPLIPTAEHTKTLEYKQDNVTDFAWFADKEWRVDLDSLLLPNNHKVHCFVYYRPSAASTWSKAIEYTKRAIDFRSKLIGPYPYHTVSVVRTYQGFSGGMEYPTITSIWGTYDSASIDGTIEHEVGHNWFQAIIATNERDHPWMDEGFNSYFDELYKYTYSPKEKKLKGIAKIINELPTYKLLAALGKDQPINTSSESATPANYGLVTYGKTAEWLSYITDVSSKDAVLKVFKDYYTNFKFKHPTPLQFDSMMLNAIPEYVKYKRYRDRRGILPSKQLATQKPIILPLIGYNKYNSIMLGAAISNYNLNSFPIKYMAVPMLGLKTKNLNGVARISYSNYFHTGKIQKINTGLFASKFNFDDFTNDRNDVRQKFLKIVPFIKFTLKEKDNRSLHTKSLELKHINISEDNLKFTQVQLPGDTFFRADVVNNNYYINQLQFNWHRQSALYPFSLQVQLEQMKDIIRTAVTAEQFFNYNSNGQGLNVRLFAGKVSYIKAKILATRIANDRYALNLTAPKGYEDYTYSNYFVGRSEFEGVSNAQILQRDGAFKFRTDLFANKPGRTDNWLASMNMVTDIPNQINPLSALPIKIPLKVFLDLGTVAEQWQPNAGGSKVLYTAGFQLSVLKDIIQIYYPILYSNDFKQYSLQIHQKARSAKNISFSININKNILRKLVPQIVW